MITLDGSTFCDGCQAVLAGYGVLYGMVLSNVEGEGLVERIYCYGNGCRDRVLGDRVRFDVTDRCSTCGAVTPRSVAVAALSVDLNPDPNNNGQRFATFCHANGCAAALDLRQVA